MTTTTTTQRGAVTESELVRALERADIHDLARALDAGYGRADLWPDRFRCPTCHRTTARVLDSLRWTCDPCADGEDDPFAPRKPRTTVSGQWTLLRLRRLVAEDYSAAYRLVREVRPTGRGRP